MCSFLINPYIYAGCPANLIDATSLMLYYKFNSTITDSSGNGDNLTMSGAQTYATGKYGDAIDLSGTANFAWLNNTNYSFAGVSDISWGLWVNADAVATGIPICKFDNTSGFGIGASATFFYAFFRSNATTYYELNDGIAPSTATWYHFVCTRKASSGEFKLYRNGAYITSASTNTNTMLDMADDFRIGAQKVSGVVQRMLNGRVDEAFVYHRVLTPTEISTIYNSTCPLKT